MDSEQFWSEASREKIETQFRVATELRYLRHTPISSLRQILLQYRYFTEAFADDLGILAARCPRGRLKSLVGQILNEELGEGDPEEAHLRLYDRFLESIGAISPGASEEHLASLIDPEVRALIEGLKDGVANRSPFYAIGLRGMGGECVCGVYFGIMNDYLREHPFIKTNHGSIDWKFWDIHAGDADMEHDGLVRAAIEELVADDPNRVEHLAHGYRHGADTWARFWKAVYKNHVKQVVREIDPDTEEARVCHRHDDGLSGTVGTAAEGHEFVTVNVSRTGLLVSSGGKLEVGNMVNVLVKVDVPVICRASVMRTSAGLTALRLVDFQLNERAWDSYVDALGASS